MIKALIHITFNRNIVSSVDDGVNHLRTVLSSGSSKEICIPSKLQSKLCQSHTELNVEILKKDQKNHSVDLSIEYPICLCGKDSGMSTFLGALLYYTVFSFVTEYHIRDFDLINEEEVFNLFSGPKHGVNGIRKLCGENIHPLMGLILKPRTKIDLTEQRRVVEELSKSKAINYIIDDELVISPRCCQYEDKIDCYSGLIQSIEDTHAHKMLYWVNASCDIAISKRIIEYGLSKGISTFSLNAVTMGFTAVRYIIEEYRDHALFLVNNIGRGILTRPPGFYISERVLSKMSRLIGADAVYTGPLTNDYVFDEKTLKEERAALQDIWGNYRKAFCVSSGDIDTTKNAKENIQALGKDTMIQMGAGLLKRDNDDVVSKLSALRFMVSHALNQDIMRELEATFTPEQETKKMTTSTNQRRDFFVSYNSADTAWATWIAEVLESNGYTVFIQEWDINPGDDFIVKMQEFLTNSNRFIPVLSSTYIDAPYCKAEWAPALATAIKDNPGFFIPVRIIDVSPEGLLKTRVYIDLFSTGEVEATKRLLDGVKPNNRKSNGFPGKTGVTASAPFPLSASVPKEISAIVPAVSLDQLSKVNRS